MRRPGDLRRPVDRSLSYALAVLLPFVADGLSHGFTVFRSAPYAPFYVAMAIVSAYGGLRPAAVVVSLSLALLWGPIAATGRLLPLTAFEVVRSLNLIISAVIISLLTRSRRRAATELADALEALRQQTVALADAQEASKCAAWTYDSRDRTRWYPGGYEVFGIPTADLERLTSPIPLIFPEDQPRVREAVKQMLESRGLLRLEYRVLWPNGELHWCEARGTPMESDPHVWRGVTFDITERKLAEAALIRSEKLAATGRLASTIAHEINNPLAAVTNLLYLARCDRLVPPAVDQLLANAESELARIGHITRLALGFSRSSPEPKTFNIAETIEGVLSIFHSRLEMKNVTVVRDYQPDVSIHMAPDELRQIAINLIANAVDALGPPDARLIIHIQREDKLAVLRVADNGSGIPEANLERIFEPFFTTKRDVGTGIGLWVTRELVEKNGGNVTVESGELRDGCRTEFRVQFPLAEPPTGLVTGLREARPATVSIH